MTWTRFSCIAAACTLLLAAGAEDAWAHKAHQKDDSVALETTENEQAARSVDPTGAERVAPAAVEPAATADSDSGHPEHHPAEASPEPVSILEWLGRLHPMVIHFPIALFFAAFVAELLHTATREEMFRHALRFTLWGGALTALIAAPLGWIFAATAATDEEWLLEAHRWTGTAALALGLVVLWIGERTERSNGGRLLLRLSLAFQALLIGSVGFLGGSLLYGFDHLWRGTGCCLP